VIPGKYDTGVSVTVRLDKVSLLYSLLSRIMWNNRFTNMKATDTLRNYYDNTAHSMCVFVCRVRGGV